jgi:ATPase family protein associated with various cellular activities (AAA)
MPRLRHPGHDRVTTVRPLRIRCAAVGRRIVFQGISGSGKTTLARRVAAALDVPFVETDALVHGPGWSETGDAELRELLRPTVEGDGWVIDSDYRRKLGTYVLEHADTVVWLDLPLRTCLRRLWGRTIPRIRRRQELWNGNTESWRDAFGGWDSLFVYAIRKHASQRRTLPQLLARPELAHLDVVHLRTPAAVDTWLGTVAERRASNMR